MFFEVIISIALALVALGLIGSLLRSFVLSAITLINTGLNLSRYKRLHAQILRIDELLESKDPLSSLALLEVSFILDHKGGREIIAAIRNHHHNLLNRMVVISDMMDLHIENLATLERLLIERSDKQLSLFDAEESLQRFQTMRKQQGKSTPQWGVDEYDSKISELRSALEQNRKLFVLELEIATSGMRQGKSGGQMYH
ncbi:MAG: hypothetical protein PHC51_07260 [bacterium]|nr:hypothetical protein [bacterium]